MGVRISIYVPDDLKSRMDKVREDIVWSQVACEAFELKLGELAKRKKDKKMEDIIQRLRASKIACENEDKNEGREAGKVWAKDRAEAAELRRLEEFIAKSSANDRDDEPFIIKGSCAYSGAECFVKAISPDQDMDRDAAYDFWEAEGFKDGSPADEYVQGFCDGALGVWVEVKDKL